MVPLALSVAVPLPSERVTGVPTTAGCPLIWVTVSVSPSTSVSLPSTLMTTDASSLVVKLSLTATGASLTGVTVIFTLAVDVLPRGSRMV